MSVLIKGMDMPKECIFCPLVSDDFKCLISHLDVSQYILSRHSACPLIEIPPEHGDLIDRSMIAFDYWSVDGYACVEKKDIFRMPVIIPADTEGK